MEQKGKSSTSTGVPVGLYGESSDRKAVPLENLLSLLLKMTIKRRDREKGKNNLKGLESVTRKGFQPAETTLAHFCSPRVKLGIGPRRLEG